MFGPRMEEGTKKPGIVTTIMSCDSSILKKMLHTHTLTTVSDILSMNVNRMQIGKFA